MSQQRQHAPVRTTVRCAIYTRKSTEEGLEKEFNSLDAQRESGEAYVRSQHHEGWECLDQHYDDGGFTGGTIERPALRRLLADEAEVELALAVFDPVWDALVPREQARIIHLLVERVDFDGSKDRVSITFHPSGIKTLADELAGHGKEQRE